MKKDNKGFSLVELIVVVAIMAVLMVVLAPQLLKYVEQSRLQKDNSAIAEICNAIEIAAANETINKEIAAQPDGLNIVCATRAAGGAHVMDLDTITNGTELAKELALTVGTEFKTSSTTYAQQAVADTLVINVKASATTGVVITVENYVAEVDGTPEDKPF